MPPQFATYFTFSEFNRGVKATHDQFREELSRFNCLLAVYVCGVMNSVTRDWQGHTRVGAVEQLVRNSFAPQAAERIVAELENAQRPRGVYHRQQLLFVAKEALLASPEIGGKDPLTAHSGDMARVLLMANDLLPKGLAGSAPTATQMINVMSEFIPIGEASGFQRPLNKILRSRLMVERFFPEGGLEIRSIFERATGVPLDMYFALCFATLCRYVDLDFKKYQADPSNYILSADWYRTTPAEATTILNFLREMSATVGEFKTALGQRRTAANDFTCFRSKPYLKDHENYLLIDPVFLAEKSESGVFWSINQGLPQGRRTQFHQDWGLAFEKYVNWLLEESVDGQLNRIYPNPKFSDTGEEVCDALLLCGESAVLVESKGATFTADAKYGTNPAKLREEIEEKLVETNGQRKGVGQLALRIENAFSRSRPREIEGVDLSRVVKVYPVLVTRDDIGAALVINAYLASRFREMFRRKSVSVTVTPPFSLSAQDIEMICGYLRDAPLSDLLEGRYRSETSLLSSFWLVDNPAIDRIGDRDCKPLTHAMHEYFDGIKNLLFPGLVIPGL